LDHARAVVDIRAGDLGRWLESQRTNAARFAANDKARAFADLASLRGANREALRQGLRSQALGFGFIDADFIDSSGHSLLGVGDAPNESVVAAAAKKSFATGASTLVDLHLDAKGGDLRFGYVAPTLTPPGAKNMEAIYTELAAREFFQPLGAWLFQNAKGSGLLAPREGDDIVLLIGLPGDDGKFLISRHEGEFGGNDVFEIACINIEPNQLASAQGKDGWHLKTKLSANTPQVVFTHNPRAR
jgi:hypothetical protein